MHRLAVLAVELLAVLAVEQFLAALAAVLLAQAVEQFLAALAAEQALVVDLVVVL